MLQRLSVQDFVTVKRQTLSFGSGLNVLTGETGVGKSVLIKSIAFALGSRSSSKMIRNGARFAEVECLFKVPDGHKALDSVHSSRNSKSTCLLRVRRRISSGNRSTVWINGKQTSLAVLREIGQQLADICGQHDMFNLLHGSHEKILDACSGEISKALQIYRNRYAKTVSLKDEILEEIEAYCRVSSDRGSSFRDRLLELNPSAEDYQQLLAKCRHLDMQRASQETLVGLADFFVDGSGETLDQRLSKLLKHVSSDLLEALGSSEEEFSRLRVALRSCQESVLRANLPESYDEQMHDKLQARLASYQGLMRQMQDISIDNLIAEKDSLLRWETQAKHFVDRIESMCLSFENAACDLKVAGEQLSELRRQAAVRLSQEVCSVMAQLDLDRAQLEVRFQEAGYLSHQANELAVEDIVSTKPCASWKKGLAVLACHGQKGRETAHLYFSTGAGGMDRLERIASGGEASRVILAIRSCMSASKTSQVLCVFDEVDTGVSGRAAHKMGLQLRRLAQQHQVIAISHLPQIAAFAKHHFMVTGLGTGGSVPCFLTSVEKASSQQRVDEIARLLSGSSITDSSRSNARALLSEGKAQ